MNLSSQRLDSNLPLEDPGDGFRAPDNSRDDDVEPPHYQVNFGRTWQSFVSQIPDRTTLTEYEADETEASPKLRNLSNTQGDLPRPSISRNINIVDAFNSSLLLSDATQSPPSTTATSVLIPIEITSPSKYILSKVEYRRRRSRSEGDIAPMHVDTQEVPNRKRNRDQANLTGDGSTSDNIVVNIDPAAVMFDTELDLAAPSLPRLRPLPGRAQRNSVPSKKKRP